MGHLRTGKPYSFASNSVLLASCLLLLAACSRPPEGMVLIPAGKFIMGSDELDIEAKAVQFGSKKPWYMNERPEREVSLEAFYIDKYEVTNREYKEFVDATDHSPPEYWEGNRYPDVWTDHPVVLVDWYSAAAYCSWKDKRLPTEAEWEKSARGTDGSEFPWGNEYDSKKANVQGMFDGPVAVGRFEAGKSPYGVYDMAGNVIEWVDDWYKAYPGSDYEDDDYGEKFKVARGGGWGGVGHYGISLYQRVSYRYYFRPDGKYNDVGFRCVKDVKK